MREKERKRTSRPRAALSQDLLLLLLRLLLLLPRLLLQLLCAGEEGGHMSMCVYVVQAAAALSFNTCGPIGKATSAGTFHKEGRAAAWRELRCIVWWLPLLGMMLVPVCSSHDDAPAGSPCCPKPTKI